MKHYLKIICYILIKLTLEILLPGKKKKGDLLIIKPSGGMGDYLLFRNFLHEVARDEKYSGRAITLVVPQEFVGYFNELDADTKIKCIGIDLTRFETDLIYVVQTAIFLSKIGYKKLICVQYSRYFYGDVLAFLANSREKIAFAGDVDEKCRFLSSKQITNKIYSRLITIKTGYSFEFNINKVMFEDLLGKKLDMQLGVPEEYLFNENIIRKLLPGSDKYIVMVIGATVSHRVWDLDNFLQLAQIIYLEFNYITVLVGTDTEKIYFERCLVDLPNYIINILGQTNFKALINLCYFSQYIISNDTGVAHLGGSLNKDTFVISSGLSYPRTHPYPENLKLKYHMIYPEAFENSVEKVNQAGLFDINLITVPQVYTQIINILKG